MSIDECPKCKSHTFKGDIDGNIVTLKCVDCGFVWKQGESPEKILIEVVDWAILVLVLVLLSVLREVE